MTPLQLMLVMIFGLIQSVCEYLLVSAALIGSIQLIKLKKNMDMCYICITSSILIIVLSVLNQNQNSILNAIRLASGLGVLLSSFFIAKYLRDIPTKGGKRLSNIIFVVLAGALLAPFFTAFLQTISSARG